MVQTRSMKKGASRLGLTGSAWNRLVRLWVAVCVVGMVGCSSPEVGRTLEVDGAYVHGGSKISLGREVGPFTRTRVADRSSDESSVLAEYYYEKGDEHVSVVVFIYPKAGGVSADDESKASALKKRLAEVKGEVLDTGPEVRFISWYDITLSQGDRHYPGKKMLFRVEANIFSMAYLFEYGDWFVEYRMVFARNLEHVAEHFLKDLVLVQGN